EHPAATMMPNASSRDVARLAVRTGQRYGVANAGTIHAVDDPERTASWQTRRMTDLDDYQRVASADHGLCVAVSTRVDGTPQVSVVNAGVLTHPVSGERIVGLVAVGGSRKLANWRRRPHATLVAKHGWEWIAVEGALEIIGPDDPSPKVEGDA